MKPIQALATAQGFLMAAFLLMIFGVGLSQAALELWDGEMPQCLEIFQEAPSATHLRVYEEDLEEASWWAKQSRPWMQYLMFAALGDAGDEGLAGYEDWMYYAPGVRYLVEPCEAVDEVVACVCDFRDQLAERGIQLLVMPAPGKASVYPEKLSRRATDLGRSLDSSSQAVMAGLREAKVEVLDLFALYNETRKKAGTPPLYLARDTHWSPEGMQRAAEAVATRLTDLGWLRPGDHHYKLVETALERHGDVLEMIRAPQVAAQFRPQPIVAGQVVEADTGALREDVDDAEVLILGDSFLRIYEQDAPGTAGFISHLAYLLKQPVASIVNDGGASTLVRQQLYTKPELLKNKKVVIWEFVERDIRFGMEGWQQMPVAP